MNWLGDVLIALLIIAAVLTTAGVVILPVPYCFQFGILGICFWLASILTFLITKE